MRKTTRFELIAIAVLVVLIATSNMLAAAEYWVLYGRHYGLGGAKDLGPVRSIAAVANAMRLTGPEAKALNWVDAMCASEQTIANVFAEAARRKHRTLYDQKVKFAKVLARHLVEGKLRRGRYPEGWRFVLVSSSLGFTTHRQWTNRAGYPSDGDYYGFEINEEGIHMKGSVLIFCGNLVVDEAEALTEPEQPMPDQPKPQATLPGVPAQPPIEVSLVTGQAGSTTVTSSLPMPVPGQNFPSEVNLNLNNSNTNGGGEGGGFEATVNMPSASAALSTSTASTSTGATSASAANSSGGVAVGGGSIHFVFRPNGR